MNRCRWIGIVLVALTAVAAIATTYILYALITDGRMPRWLAARPSTPDCAGSDGQTIAFDAKTGRTPPLVLLTTGCSKAIVAVGDVFAGAIDGCEYDWVSPQIIRLDLKYLESIELVRPVRFEAKSTDLYGKTMSYGDEVHVVAGPSQDLTVCSDAFSDGRGDLWWVTPGQVEPSDNLTLTDGASHASTYFLERTDGNESADVLLGDRWWLKSKCPDSIEHSHTYVASETGPIAEGGGGTFENDVLYQGTLYCTTKETRGVCEFVAVTYPKMKRVSG